jgi:FkbM family methyltransferase
MITNSESTVTYQDNALEKQIAWKEYCGCLPEIDIALNHTCYGCRFGVYAICTDVLPDNAIIYSFGVGKDISFEKELYQAAVCEFHLFDPTPASITWIEKKTLPDRFSFHSYGISSLDQFIYLFPPSNPKRTSHSIVKHKWAAENPIQAPAKSLQTIATELAHDHIDVLKMDIEGAEYSIIEGLASIPIHPKQIIVEFHHHYPEIGLGKTQKAIAQLRRLGYKLFSYSFELEEFSFILEKK